MTLLDQIVHAQKTRDEIAARLAEQDALIKQLQQLRFQCVHDFAPAIKGYEHEGGTCKLCGINEVYWLCQGVLK